MLSSNFWCLRSVNPVKFTEECVICTEKQVLVKKIVYKWAKHEFATTNPSWKESPWSRNTDSPVKKKKVQDAVVSKEDHAASLLEYKTLLISLNNNNNNNNNNNKRVLPISNSFSKIHCIYWMSLVVFCNKKFALFKWYCTSYIIYIDIIRNLYF